MSVLERFHSWMAKGSVLVISNDPPRTDDELQANRSAAGRLRQADGLLAQFLLQLWGTGGSDPLVDGQGLAQELAPLAVVVVEEVAPAEAFEGSRLLELGGDAGGDGQCLLVVGARVGRLGGAADDVGDVVEGLGFAGAVAQVAVELQRAGVAGLSGRVVPRAAEAPRS